MYQTHSRVKPDAPASINTGIAVMTIRDPEVISDGIVLPIAWNMLEVTKITPDATKFQATTCRYTSPTEITAGSPEKICTMRSPKSHTRTARTNMAVPAIPAAGRTVR